MLIGAREAPPDNCGNDYRDAPNGGYGREFNDRKSEAHVQLVVPVAVGQVVVNESGNFTDERSDTECRRRGPKVHPVNSVCRTANTDYRPGGTDGSHEDQAKENASASVQSEGNKRAYGAGHELGQISHCDQYSDKLPEAIGPPGMLVQARAQAWQPESLE